MGVRSDDLIIFVHDSVLTKLVTQVTNRTLCVFDSQRQYSCANTLAQVPTLWGQRSTTCLCEGGKSKLSSRWQPGAIGHPMSDTRGSSCAPAGGWTRLAADLRKFMPGRPGLDQREKAAGSRLGAGERERTGVWPRWRSQQRKQGRAHASCGPCGRVTDDISPRGTWSGRVGQSQVHPVPSVNVLSHPLLAW